MSSPHLPFRPSALAIASAISIVQSKPDHLSIRAYLAHLRTHIAPGPRAAALSSTHKHLDRAAYWRGEYERSRDYFRESEAETAELRREIEGLKVRLAKAREDGGAAGGKRKRGKVVDEDVVLVPRSPKKAKVQGVEGTEVARDFDFAGVGQSGNLLLRSLYHIHTTLKRHRGIDPALLAHHLVRAASAVPQVIRQCYERVLNPEDARAETTKLQNVLAACERTVAMLLVGVNRLSVLNGGEDVVGHVVYAFAKMFAAVLGCVELASDAETARDVAVRSGTTKTKVKTVLVGEDGSLLESITSLLTSMLEGLNPTFNTHRALFEAFAFSTLEMLGARLYLVVFGHARPATLEEEIACSISTPTPSSSDSDDDDDEAASLRDASFCKTRLESPYLIHLLSRVLAAAPSFLDDTATAGTTGAGALTQLAKDRLQATLLQCMFGTEGLEDADPLLVIESLRMPGKGSKPLMVPKDKEKHGEGAGGGDVEGAWVGDLGEEYRERGGGRG